MEVGWQKGEKATEQETVWDTQTFVATKPLDIFSKEQDIFQLCQW